MEKSNSCSKPPTKYIRYSLIPLLVQQSTNKVPGSDFPNAKASPGIEDQLQPQHVPMAEAWVSESTLRSTLRSTVNNPTATAEKHVRLRHHNVPLGGSPPATDAVTAPRSRIEPRQHTCSPPRHLTNSPYLNPSCHFPIFPVCQQCLHVQKMSVSMCFIIAILQAKGC